MTLFDDLVNDVLQDLYGYGIAQPRASFLSGDLDGSATQINVNDASDFEQGVAEIDNETVFIESVDTGSNVLTVSPDGRGYYGSTAAAHSTDARITMAPTWSRQRVARAINETILGTYPTLFAKGADTIAFNPSVTTYEIDAAAERILRVTADTIGPTREALEIKRYSFNSVASSDFASGNSITLEKGAFPGRNINVTYSKAPTEITFGQEFTACGLAETAKYAIKLGACSNLLAYLDASRLPVDTAQADELDPTRNAIGNATRISAQLYQRYQMELETERKRLRAATPPTVTVRTR
jgi:hypothetical protein